MSASTPSWYDLLGVDPGAPADEIRTAWKASIADLEPTDRRFRLMNQAAEVLLDPELRRDYDDSLEPDQPEPPVVEVGGAPATIIETSEAGAGSEPETAAVETDGGLGARKLARRPSSSGRGVPGWLLAGLAIVAVALVGACVWAVQTAPPTDAEVADATADAQAAAERAIVAVVSYDYRSLDDDQANASDHMTDDYRKDYEALFEVIGQNAPETKTVLSTEVVASSITRAGDDRVQVFMFINNATLRADITEPEVQRNQVTVTMEKVGDEWLVDDLSTTLPSS